MARRMILDQQKPAHRQRVMTKRENFDEVYFDEASYDAYEDAFYSTKTGEKLRNVVKWM